MGVATDKSLQGLTTAVTNISATGMSDTTGQAIVSAINGLSGAISPAAVNVTFDNTGTGLNASNVQSAITELNTVTTSTTGTGGFTLRKINNIVELKGTGVRADQLGIMPIGFRPVNSSYLPIATMSDGSNHYYNGYLYINSANGEIQARYLNNGVATLVTASNWQVYVCAQYVL